MEKTQATIIRIGNSYGIRLPKEYMKQQGIKPGDSVELPKKVKPNNKEAAAALREIAKLNGVLANIDIKKWEVDRKAAYIKREKEYRDILGH